MTAAYQKAVELDPDDEQGVGANAQSRIDALTGAEDEASSDDEGTTTQEDDSSETAE